MNTNTLTCCEMVRSRGCGQLLSGLAQVQNCSLPVTLTLTFQNGKKVKHYCTRHGEKLAKEWLAGGGSEDRITRHTR